MILHPIVEDENFHLMVYEEQLENIWSLSLPRSFWEHKSETFTQFQ